MPEFQEFVQILDKKLSRTKKISKRATTSRNAKTSVSQSDAKILWAQCEACAKWRKLPKSRGFSAKESFRCGLLKGGDCSRRQEKR